MQIKGIIFDLDGTLLDSMPIWETLGGDYLVQKGIVPEIGINEKFKTLTTYDAAKYYKTHYGLKESVKTILEEINKHVEYQYLHVFLLKKSVHEFLKKMVSNKIKLCVATASERYIVEAALKRNGVFKYFDSILTCTEVGYAKTEPAIFNEALKQLGTKKTETLIFEDALHAIQTAKLAGFTVVGIEDKSAESEKNKIQKLTDYYIKSNESWSEWYDKNFNNCGF
ncbi:MAG: hypothetical protein BKP49_02565 [Treponema sp. CETP13]|nr:MAG: hypothetical protein BKP49_02565 [Treponema sp. CETP13]